MKKPEAKRVEHMTCPKCKEVLLIGRDDKNMSILPECSCGYKVGLSDLLRQMSVFVK